MECVCVMHITYCRNNAAEDDSDDDDDAEKKCVQYNYWLVSLQFTLKTQI